MKKRNLQNAELDRTGRKLLETTRASNDEIDRIVGSPQLFDAVKARIKAEQQREERREERQPKNVFGDWRSLLAWNRQKTFAATAALTVFALVAFGVIVFTKQKDSPTISAQRISPPVKLSPAPVNIPAPPPMRDEKDLPEIENVKNFAPKNGLSFQKAAYRDETAALPKQTPRKRNFAPLPQQQQRRRNEIEPDGEFYALTYAGNPGEHGEDLRIVRAELSRAALFAMGVNLPIENESEKIKTDLLVGADGVAKAIRFVR